jgi:hypothetical protein
MTCLPASMPHWCKQLQQLEINNDSVEVSPFWSRWPDIIAEIRHNGLYKFEVG